MSNFLWLFRGGYQDYNQLSDEEREALNQDWTKWLENLKQAGKLIEGLPLSQEGRVVYNRGELVTNGPFAEGAEVVGGYTIISAQDLAEAVALSKGNPHFGFEEGTLEVRQIINDEVH
ncbi:YciI family protein [Flagellimonas sp.]|uniref:YciI family protein n=1 Tax=Flagellimonas sp. TaxID=2058762 RepID=UPI003B51795D